MTDIETIREALEAYKALANDLLDEVCQSYEPDVLRSEEALRLFDEMVKAEPVAWMCDAQDGANCDATAVRRTMEDYVRFGRKITPLYTNPIACKPQEGIKHITDPADLIVGSLYWLRDKRGERKTILAECKHDAGFNWKYFGEGAWTDTTNNYGMTRWDIFGPVRPHDMPDFDALKEQP